MKETLLTIDWVNVYKEVKSALETGNVIIRDGVAYWHAMSGKSGIAQHLPLKEVVLETASIGDIKQLTQMAQTVQLAAVGVSTGIIVGAMVVQTMYLSKKIDQLQQSMDLISEDVHAQNVIFYMDKLSRYFGVVESARVMLLDRTLVDETHDVAAHLIVRMGNERNEVLSFIDNLLSFADKLSDRHLEQVLDFITLMLDLVPKAIYIESQLCDRYGKFRLAEHLMRENSRRYAATLEHYRQWCNSKVKESISGRVEPQSLAFTRKQEDLRLLFKSEDNALLLQELVSIAPLPLKA
ncbi:hypothetical protein ACOMQ0_003556 [Enterobacter quasiroggenkampii]